MAENGERKRLVRPPTRGSAEGRGMGERVRTADQRSLSSQKWLERQLNDPYVQLARTRGYRSRAAFKLLEIEARFHLLKPGARIVDLGCAPGGWTQVALECGAARVVGVDLLPVEPVGAATLILGDFTDPGIEAQVRAALGGEADVVFSDMAPNTLGHRQTDHLRILRLIEAASRFALEVLRPGGAFVAKAFQGGGMGETLALLKGEFRQVRQVKPPASRSESSETFLVATGRRAPARVGSAAD